MPRNGSGTYTRVAGTPYVYNTVISETTVNSEMDDIATAITGSIAKDGQTTPTANLPMGTYRHTGVGNGSARTDYAAMGQVQDGKVNWVDGGGTADAITATYSPAITSLVDGQLCFVRATAANATTTPTFAPNGLTARTIVKRGGGALLAGDIVGDGHELALRYDLTNTRWELLNPGAVVAMGQCYLSKSGANLLLSPQNGNKILINGSLVTIPSAGVTLAATSLSPGTVYYIYAYMNSGTLTLEASTTARATDTTTGMQIKNGDATRSLVGLAYCTTGPAWLDDSANIGVISWFNRKKKTARAAFTANRTTTSTSGAEINSEIRTSFLNWSDAGFTSSLNGGTFNSTTATAYTYIGIDGSSATDCGGAMYGTSTAMVAADYASSTTENAYHYATLCGFVATASTQTWLGSANSSGQRCTCQVVVEG